MPGISYWVLDVTSRMLHGGGVGLDPSPGIEPILRTPALSTPPLRRQAQAYRIVPQRSSRIAAVGDEPGIVPQQAGSRLRPGQDVVDPRARAERQPSVDPRHRQDHPGDQ